MTRVTISPTKLKGEVFVPGSKSYTHRAVVLATLAKGKSKIENALLSRDTIASIKACESMGAIIKSGKSLTIEGNQLKSPEDVINAENSGTTIRFITAIASLIPTGYTIITGDKSIRSRPMQPLISALSTLGVKCYSSRQNGFPPLIVKGGGLIGGETVNIQGDISSQFTSALLITGPKAKNSTCIHVHGKKVSKPYIDATLAMVNLFRGIIKRQDYKKYVIPANQQYIGQDVLIPGDMSSAALLIASTISSKGKIKIKGMNFTLPQADSYIIEILKNMGISFKFDPMDDCLLINGDQEVRGGEFNLSDCPDLLPVLSILALKANSEVSITGIKHARYKETDRIHVIANELSKTGARIKELAGGLIISPSRKLKGCHLNSHNDHRLFMSFCAYAIGADNTCTVEGLESVDVSYPKFIGDLKSLGAKIEVR